MRARPLASRARRHALWPTAQGAPLPARRAWVPRPHHARTLEWVCFTRWGQGGGFGGARWVWHRAMGDGYRGWGSAGVARWRPAAAPKGWCRARGARGRRGAAWAQARGYRGGCARQGRTRGCRQGRRGNAPGRRARGRAGHGLSGGEGRGRARGGCRDRAAPAGSRPRARAGRRGLQRARPSRLGAGRLALPGQLLQPRHLLLRGGGAWEGGR
jgi:hypothetical protein